MNLKLHHFYILVEANAMVTDTTDSLSIHYSRQHLMEIIFDNYRYNNSIAFIYDIPLIIN